jgi:hypothetical protein
MRKADGSSRAIIKHNTFVNAPIRCTFEPELQYCSAVKMHGPAHIQSAPLSTTTMSIYKGAIYYLQSTQSSKQSESESPLHPILKASASAPLADATRSTRETAPIQHFEPSLPTPTSRHPSLPAKTLLYFEPAAEAAVAVEEVAATAAAEAAAGEVAGAAAAEAADGWKAAAEAFADPFYDDWPHW